MSDTPVTLRIIQVTDVYKLDNFPSLKTLIAEKRGTKEAVISVLTGDFLAPYLLSSLDKGKSMMNTLNETPIDYLTWGNHEDDLEHRFVCQRVKDYKGKWINTNMQSHEMMSHQQAYDVVEVKSADGKHTRKVGLIAVLSNTPSLYRKSAFNGAKIEDPYETIAEYKDKLEKQQGCDLVVPMCHLYVPQDMVTCERFDFPVVLSGHDHHVVNEIFHGTRLCKSGADANKAIIVDITWANSDPNCKPTVEAEVVTVSHWSPDAQLQQNVKRAYSLLSKLEHTEICTIPPQFRPLTSVGSRNRLVTIASFIATVFKMALNSDDATSPTHTMCDAHHEASCEAVIIAGGDIRGGRDYAENSFFSLKDLKCEIQEKFKMALVDIPGSVIQHGVKLSQGKPNPGFLQYDDGVKQDSDGNVTHIHGKPIEPSRVYRVAMSLWDIKAGSSKPIVEYFKEHADQLPDDEATYPVYTTLLGYFAKSVWTQLFKLLDADGDGELSAEELAKWDTDGDGKLSKAELVATMKVMGKSVCDDELGFVDQILLAAGDANKDGHLDSHELGVKQDPKRQRVDSAGQ